VKEAYRERGILNLVRTRWMKMRMKGGEKKEGLTGIDRSVNLRANGGVVRLAETDLEMLVANVALHLGDIRGDFNGDVGDCVDGGVGGIG
jgi:hypothetical protein